MVTSCAAFTPPYQVARDAQQRPEPRTSRSKCPQAPAVACSLAFGIAILAWHSFHFHTSLILLMLISAIIYGARLSRNDVLHARRVTRTSNEETSSRSTWQAASQMRESGKPKDFV